MQRHRRDIVEHASGSVRRQHDVVHLEKLARRRQRLRLEGIEPRRQQLAGVQRRHHGLLIDDVAACAIDQDRAALHAGKALGVDDVMVGFAAGAMQREDVALGHQLVERHVAGVELLLDLFAGPVGIMIDDLDFEALQALGDVLADIAEAENADRLAGQLAAERTQLGVDPFARAHAAVGHRDAPQRAQDQQHGVLGHSARVRTCGDRHRNTLSLRAFQVDLVDADAPFVNQPQLRRFLESFSVTGIVTSMKSLSRTSGCAASAGIDAERKIELRRCDVADDRLGLRAEGAADAGDFEFVGRTVRRHVFLQERLSVYMTKLTKRKLVQGTEMPAPQAKERTMEGPHVENAALERMRAGEVTLGLVVRLARSGEIAAIAKASGHDFLFIDTQHALFSLETIGHIAQAAIGCGVATSCACRATTIPISPSFSTPAFRASSSPMSPMRIRREKSSRPAVSRRLESAPSRAPIRSRATGRIRSSNSCARSRTRHWSPA